MFSRVILGLSVLLLAALVVSCGGSSSPNTSPDPTATPAVIEPTETPAESPTEPAPAATETPAATLPPDGNIIDQTELISQGKTLFDTDAGGVGCALCHGLDGKGKPELATPQNRGATEDEIWAALGSRAQMAFLVLTNEEVRAIAAYLKVLETQP